ncbi:MAG: hypothetical protein EG825_14905 [Rhodocyclaceae bacterium]|nr:hypothetical protein [Rhodocyclaceae bacterium]
MIDPSSEYAYVRMGYGDGTFGPRIKSGDGANFTGINRSLADINGDGKIDIVMQDPGSNYIYVRFGNGDGIFGPRIKSGDGTNMSGVTRLLGDANGDGLTDAILVDPGSDYAYVSPANGKIPDLLKKVNGGLGLSPATLTYAPLTDNATYTKDTGANSGTYPTMDIQSPLYVTSSVASGNGLGGVTTTNYKYGGLKAEVGTGRGLLGFRWIEATQVETGITSRTEYRQDWPYVGLPSLVKKLFPGGGNAGVLSQTSSTYGCLNPANGNACVVAFGNRYFPYLSQSIESGWDLNGAALPVVTTSNQFDSYGNATQVTVSTGDGYSKTTTHTYSNDTANPNWILGRLLRSQVQSITP